MRERQFGSNTDKLPTSREKMHHVVDLEAGDCGSLISDFFNLFAVPVQEKLNKGFDDHVAIFK